MTPNILSETAFYQAQLSIQASGADLPILLMALISTNTNGLFNNKTYATFENRNLSIFPRILLTSSSITAIKSRIHS